MPDLRRKARGFPHAGVRRLEPEQIGMRRVCDGAFGRRGQAGAVVVEALAGARDVPVEGDGGAGGAGGELAAFVEG